MAGKQPSLAQQNALLLALAFILFELLTAVVMAGLVLVPMARRSADDMANLMILSAQTWSELPPETRGDFELELARTYQLALRAGSADSTATGNDPWHSLYLYFLESALNDKTGQVRHVSREIVGNSHWYWRSVPSGGGFLSVGFPERRIGAQPFVAFAVSSLIALTLAALAAIWLARRSVVPLARLEAAAERVGRGEAPAVIPETGPRELAALSRRFNEMATQVRELLSARTILLAGVSHDLRTPMARMRLALAMLAEKPAPHLIERLEADIAEMDSLIGRVLELARDLAPETDSVIEVEGLLQDLAAGMPRDRIGRISVPHDLEISAPASALKRVIGNLLDNSVRYGADEPVDIVAEFSNAEVSIGVLDRGPGIPPDQLKAVFQPFHRVESSRSPVTGGAGLGLAIVRQLVDAHGWRIEIKPRASGGMEAWLRLPIH